MLSPSFCPDLGGANISLFERPKLMRKRLFIVGLLAGSHFVVAAPVQAETLRDALVKAYRTNPTLTGARAGQRALDEGVPIAKSRERPTVNLQGQYVENLQRSSNSFSSPVRIASGRLALDVPIYQGGQVKNAIRAADARIDGGQANLRATESSVFSGVVAAYLDVIRDGGIAELQAKQVQVLSKNLEATRDRFEVGDLTRTDIAQSESRLAIARSDLQTAEAQLIASREQYIRLIGSVPLALEEPPALPNLPATPEAAVDKALASNPDLIAANKSAEAARFDIKSARGAGLPTVSASAEQNYSNFLNSLQSGVPGVNFAQTSKTRSASVQLSIPIYAGGQVSAQVRQAQARSSQAIEQIIEAERDVISQTRSAYARWRASNEVIVSSQAAVAAAMLSLEGVRAENSVGNRTILDILNAEQELLNAQVQLVGARRNAYVAGFTLLAAMGQAEARDLGLDGGALYDPEVNYKRVRNKFLDFDGDAPKPAEATRTVDTPAQNPPVRR
jgi:outer membrane protein